MYHHLVTALAQRLDEKLNEWTTNTAANVEMIVNEIIELADVDALELARVRTVEQEVINLIDVPQAR